MSKLFTAITLSAALIPSVAFALVSDDPPFKNQGQCIKQVTETLQEPSPVAGEELSKKEAKQVAKAFCKEEFHPS